MASITRDKSGAWRARYRDPDGQQRSRNFPRRREAELFLTEYRTRESDSGAYVDPVLGKITIRPRLGNGVAKRGCRSSTFHPRSR